MINSLVILMKSGLCDIARWSGLKRPVPPGMPNEACWSFPVSFWNLFKDIRFDRVIFFINSLMAKHLGGGSCRVKFSPSSIHPSTSFLWSQEPSPFMSFDSETGLWPLCPLSSGGGNTECTPCIIALETLVRCSSDMSFVIPIKSSTNTSTSVVDELSGADGFGLVCCGDIICFSNLCGGRFVFSFKSVSITSRAVSDPAQKNGGLSHQPICKLLGTTISRSSMLVDDFVGGRT